MKVIAIAFAAAGVICGWYASTAFHRGKVTASPTEARESRDILYYQSPMHPWVKSAVSGQCTVCGMDLVPVYRNAAGSGQMGGDAVLLSPESVRAIGVQTVPVQRAPLRRTLRVAGNFEEDASTHALISAPVEGRIDGLGLVHGNGRVVQRQPLATIYSRTLLSAARKYKEALNRDEAAALAAKRELEHCGLVWEQIKTIPLRQENDIYFGILSPRTGYVVESFVHEGQYVLEGDKLFEITDPAKLWFMFPAFEQDLPLLEVGQIVEIETPGLPGEKIKAPIAAIGRQLEEGAHSVRVRVEVEDRKSRIPRHASGTGLVNLEASEVLAVPRAAVLWPGGNPRVYVELHAGVYEPRAVKLGRVGDDAWEVLSGLSEGDGVVTSAGMLIDGQAQLSAAAQ